jgi:hypothetical protein
LASNEYSNIVQLIAEQIVKAVRELIASNNRNYLPETLKNTQISADMISGEMSVSHVREFDAVTARIAAAVIKTAKIDAAQIENLKVTDAEIGKMQRYYQNPLSDYIDKTPVLDMQFDYNTSNNGSYDGVIEEEGTLTYGEGYYGGAGRFDDASVDLPELELGKSDLTFAFWFNTEEVNYKVDGKTTGYTYTSNIFSTAYRANSDYQGIQVMYNREINSIFVQTSNQYNSARGYLWASVKDIVKNNEWMHVTVVINTTPAADQDYVEIYVNFEKLPLASVTSPAYFGQNTFDGGEGFTPHIGADGQGYVGNYTPRGYIDEFLMFDSALTADEIAKLGEYYNQ